MIGAIKLLDILGEGVTYALALKSRMLPVGWSF
jgi:hypothetical protein